MVAGVAAAADKPTVAESNGFKSCVAAAERDARELRIESTYYIKHDDESRTYYLNGNGRTADAVGRIRIACETNASGRRVTDLAVASGRFVPRFEAAGEVAAN
jgi:hypothetical protein